MQDLRTTVVERLSQNDWNTDQRRRYLERLGTLTAGSKVRLNFESIPTAACAYKENRGYHEIMIRDNPINVSDLGDLANKLGESTVYVLFQEGLLYHELGHVLMSDYDAWEDAISSGSLKRQKMAKQFLNCTEDVVIEAWLRRKFDCGKTLDFKNECKLYALESPGQISRPMSKHGKFTYYANLFNGEFPFVLDMIESVGRFDGHWLEWAEKEKYQLFTKYEGTIREMVSQAVCEPDAEKRYSLILDVFDEVWDEVRKEEPADEGRQSAENPSGGEQMQEPDEIPNPEPDEGDDGEGEDGEDGEGSEPDREARSLSQLLKGRDPEEVKVVI